MNIRLQDSWHLGGARSKHAFFEILKGDEGKYRCLGLAGVQLADNQDNRITLSLVPDGIFDIEKKAWQTTASKAVAQVLKECYGGVAPNVLGVTGMHALGVTASTQAVSQHLIHFEPPLGAVLPSSLPRVFPYPSGEVSHHPSHGPQKALLMPVKARYLLDGNAMGGYFYPRGSKDKPHYATARRTRSG